jgi:acyl-CoA hydrolase
VYVGQLVNFRAMVNAAWRTSVEVGVRVEAEDIRGSGEVRHVSTAYLTMVALDEDGRPAAVPGLEPSTDDERRRQREAEWRRENRLSERSAIVEARAADEQTSSATS